MRGLMLGNTPCKPERTLQVEGVLVKFSLAHIETKVSMHFLSLDLLWSWLLWEQLGDYGYFSHSKHFGCQGNLFSDIKFLIPKAKIIPTQQEVMVMSQHSTAVVIDNLGLSLPSNEVFNSLLALLSPQLTDAYLVTRIVQCTCKDKPCANILHPMSDGWISF